MKYSAGSKSGGSYGSPSMRRVWIEITTPIESAHWNESPSMRRVWIEIKTNKTHKAETTVTLHAEGVD